MKLAGGPFDNSKRPSVFRDCDDLEGCIEFAARWNFLPRTTEVSDVNRLATICVAILIAYPAVGHAQESRVAGNLGRPKGTVAAPTRSEGVPRPARPVGRLASNRTVRPSLLQESEVLKGPAPQVISEGVVSEGMVTEGMIIEDGETIYEETGGCSSCGDNSCSSCQTATTPFNSFGIDLCNPGGFDGKRLCICLPSHGWVSVEYLGWYQAGMNTPPLVTTSPNGTAQSAAGVLPGATVLFGGNNETLTDTMNGLRVRVGVWSATRKNAGAEGEYFGFGQQTESFDRNSTGNPILARPFYNNVTGLQDSELVAFPGLLSGRVQVEATSQLASAAVRFRHILCCSNSCGYSTLACAPVQAQSRFDATLGWRYMQLSEGLMIQEDLVSQSSNNPGSFLIRDEFNTYNQFNGVEMGVQWMGRRGFWSLETLMRVNFGNTLQRLNINGTTQSPSGGAASAGGLLAQPGRNIGSYESNEFAMVPELGTTIGYQLTERLKFNLGYTFLYWSNVVRPGDQIDTTVNPNLLPPSIGGNTFLGPAFAVRETDYWVQGLSIGGEYRW